MKTLATLAAATFIGIALAVSFFGFGLIATIPNEPTRLALDLGWVILSAVIAIKGAFLVWDHAYVPGRNRVAAAHPSVTPVALPVMTKPTPRRSSTRRPKADTAAVDAPKPRRTTSRRKPTAPAMTKPTPEPEVPAEPAPAAEPAKPKRASTRSKTAKTTKPTPEG